MALEDLLEEMQSKAEKLKELHHTVLFDLGDDGKILLDATGDEVKITPNPESDEAETTLALSADNMVKLINGDSKISMKGKNVSRCITLYTPLE